MVGSRVQACTQHADDVAELRLLLELAALRRLANRGLSDQECAEVKRLADATMRAAGRGDVPGYLRADRTFHRSLLELTGDPAIAGLASVLLAWDHVRTPGTGGARDHMTSAAREHGEIAVLLADGMASAAGELLRLHLSGLPDARPASVAPGPARSGQAGGSLK